MVVLSTLYSVSVDSEHRGSVVINADDDDDDDDDDDG